MGDPIARLPTNPAAVPSDQDKVLVNQLFGDTVDKKALSSMLQNPMLAAALTGLVLLPATDGLIGKFVPAAKESPYTMILVKMIIVALLYWVVTHWFLARK